jgi:transposase-like protein
VSISVLAQAAFNRLIFLACVGVSAAGDIDNLAAAQGLLVALLGKDACGLSSSNIGRLKEAWSDEHMRWSKRDLSAKRYIYFWADGIHVQARLEDEAQCLLVIIGATPEGKKELVGLIDGVRESAQSWRELLLDLKRRGLAIAPELAVADGALGFWQAIEEVWQKTRGQRCWVHYAALRIMPTSATKPAWEAPISVKDADLMIGTGSSFLLAACRTGR